MLADLRVIDAGTPLAADTCIIGAGAAGITLARALANAGHRVLLLESGDKDFRQVTQDLYQGANVGMPYYDLVDSRLRFVGGTTNIWGGRSVPLAPIDFECRDWVPHSGWPISYEDLAPYYERAHQALELGEFAYRDLWRQLGSEDPFAAHSELDSTFWRFDEQAERFGWNRTADVRDHPRIQLIVNANLRHLAANADAQHITGATAVTLEGNEHRVHADRFVLATGGIENARLLLACNDVQPRGIGNNQDQVGRYFMEHPHGRAAFVDVPNAFDVWFAYRKRGGRGKNGALAPALTLSADAQRHHQTLNSALTFKLQDPNSRAINKRLYGSLKHSLAPTAKARALWQGYRRGRDLVHNTIRPQVERLRHRYGGTQLALILRAEQAPNPHSRVVLGEQTDAIGLRQAQLDWQLNALDKHSVRTLAEQTLSALGVEAANAGLEAWLTTDDTQWPVDPSVGNHPIGGYHHMGTTRMSGNAQSGVVDKHCRVHGYDNLFIAGSSVFTTSGWANPTLTIMALALRLADHLGTQRDN